MKNRVFFCEKSSVECLGILFILENKITQNNIRICMYLMHCEEKFWALKTYFLFLVTKKVF